MAIKAAKQGSDDLIKWVQARRKGLQGNKIRVSVVAEASTKRLPWAGKVEKRTAGKNSTIWNSLKKKRNRDPVFFRAKDLAFGKKLFVEAMNRFMRNPSVEAFDKEMSLLGDFMIGVIREHIYRGQSAVGQMRVLNEKYARYKERHWPGKPILIRTGALISSLSARVRLGGRSPKIVGPKTSRNPEGK